MKSQNLLFIRFFLLMHGVINAVICYTALDRAPHFQSAIDSQVVRQSTTLLVLYCASLALSYGNRKYLVLAAFLALCLAGREVLHLLVRLGAMKYNEIGVRFLLSLVGEIMFTLLSAAWFLNLLRSSGHRASDLD